MKLKMGLIGLTALAMAGCSGNEISSYYKPKLEISENGVKAEVSDLKREGSLPVGRTIEFTRRPNCCDSLEVNQNFSYLTCIKDGRRLELGLNYMGQELWIHNHHNGKDSLNFADFDCDWHVDRVYNSRLGQFIDLSEGDKEFFERADEAFYNALDRIMKDIDINEAIRKFNALPKPPEDFLGGNE